MISDEAHRTQYGRLALNMRKALPKAKFIGFTGTPLIDNAEKQLTREVFGDYVSIYDFQRAVADGATLPLFYENRGEKLRLVDPTLNERIRERIETARREGELDEEQEENAISAIYHRLQGFRRAPDVSAVLQALYEVVDTAVTTEPVEQAGEAGSRYDLSAIDFARLRAEFERSPYKNVIMLNLKERLAARLDRMVACNPTRMDLYERYRAIIQAYNKDKDDAEIQRVFDALMQFNSELDQEERRYLREGLDNEDQLAVFDLLQKDTLNRSERERIKQIARELLERLLADKLRLDHWREKATAQAQIKIEIIDHLLLNLPPECYDPAEIELKANLVFAHLFASDLGGEKRVYH